MKLALLLSGNLGLEILQQLVRSTNIEFVATDLNSGAIIAQCEKYNIPIFIGNPRKGRLHSFASEFECETLLSINYLFLIENDVINLFKVPINFHGSLLPKYRGRTPHVWAIINNERECGITAHYMDSGCDTGDIVMQRKVAIDANDTGNDLLLKYVSLYPQMVRDILYQIENGDLQKYVQNESLATYYGKRSPEDGQINWNWQKERIRNWVRALSHPYPGSFTYINGIKIIIDEIEFSDVGYDFAIPNGCIINSEPLLVKTPNGAVLLKTMRDSELKKIIFKDNILGNEDRSL
ncbi:MAG TPA: methionyl-tRNA formyltransferase [Pedobacter sp.]|nr:methionyl-tRNA formyltransferase [Pedobacter sp.]